MKFKRLAVYGLLPVFITGFFCCTKDTVSETYTFYRPVYETSDAARNNIKSAVAQPVQSPGKLVIKDHYLYLTESGKGVHIIDYSNPREPKNIAFVAVPGNADIAVRGNYLYADCYTALAVINIAEPEHAKLENFVNSVFPDRYYGLAADTGKMIVSWQKVDTTVSRHFSESFDKSLDGRVIVVNDIASFSSSASYNNGAGSVSNSTGGSMARFALADDRMYAVGTGDLKVFNTTVAAKPVYVRAVNIGTGIETIFPYKNNLFIGSQTGMFIYSLSNKDVPALAGQFTHVRTCDPVIAEDKYAYVTLRNGSACGGYTNQLDVLNITSLTSPSLIKSYNLNNPHGLSKEGNLLFICDGTWGLKIFNAENPYDIRQIGVLEGIETFDVIALNGTALVAAKDAFYFVEYSNPAKPTIISRLNIAK